MTTTATQTRVLARWFATGSSKVLAFALAIATLVSVAVWALATVQGWTVPIEPVDAEGQVFFEFSTTAFGIPLAAVGIAAFVLSIVQTASYTRSLVASGATRASVAGATLLNGALMVVLVNVLAAVVLALEARFAGGWVGSTFGLAPGATFADGVPVLVHALGQVAFAVVAGMTIAAVFLRWPWWVGVGTLAIVLWGLPLLAFWFEPLAALGAAAVSWPGAMPLGVVALAGAYWVVMRGLRIP